MTPRDLLIATAVRDAVVAAANGPLHTLTANELRRINTLNLETVIRAVPAAEPTGSSPTLINIAEINQVLDDIDRLATACANGDGDDSSCVAHAEDALLFKVLSAIAQGAPEAQALAAYAIDACAFRLQGRCHQDAHAAPAPQALICG